MQVGVFFQDTFANNLQTGPQPVDDNWRHYVLTYDQGTQRRTIWLNGELLAEDSNGGWQSNFSSGLLVGAQKYSTGWTEAWFEGALDELGVWSRALSEEEILSLYLSEQSIPGCPDLWACNYNPEATDDDDSCEYLSCVGCLNSLACNYDSYATLAGSCDFPDEGCEECVDGVVIAIDIDNDGVADCDELDGCTDPAACNFMPAATEDDGSCLYLPEASLASSAGVSPEGLLTVDVPVGLDTWHWSDGSVAVSRGIVPFQEYVLTGSVGVAPEVGQVTEEGIVFHVDEDEQWALLASPSSIGSGVEWGCKFVTTGAVGSALGDGASNTAMILEVCDDPMAAARVASEYGDGWFLPSLDELGAIYEHVHAAGLGEYFVDNTYNWFWSSTECATDGTAAGDIWFQNGDAHACNNKDSNPGGVIAAKRLDYAQCTYTDTLYVALGATPPVCGPGTVWDEASHSCIVAYPSDTDFDGCVTMTDLLDLLTVFGTCNWECGEDLEYQGQTYSTIQIGEQCWFEDNLATSAYCNGEPIIEYPDGQGWASTGAAGGAYNNSSANASTYGFLYNAYAALDPRGVCPSGWSVPSDADWTQLEVELGMSPTEAMEYGWRGDPVGHLMKSSTAFNGSNDSGFNGFPGGARDLEGTYYVLGGYGVWWSSSLFDDERVWARQLGNNTDEVQKRAWEKEFGFSVRCIKDSE